MRWRGSAAELHTMNWPEPLGRTVWRLDVGASALVLGSGQPEGEVQGDATARLGLEVVRRRSGGGAVLVGPADVLWVDLLLPRSDPLWAEDIGVAPRWVGQLWRAALSRLGIAAEVHQGGMSHTRWSGQACFAGLGPGEVCVDGRKIVGISQRRARAGARFQTALLLTWRPGPLAEVFGWGPEVVEELAPMAVGLVDLVDRDHRVAPLDLADAAPEVRATLHAVDLGHAAADAGRARTSARVGPAPDLAKASQLGELAWRALLAVLGDAG